MQVARHATALQKAWRKDVGMDVTAPAGRFRRQRTDRFERRVRCASAPDS